ncbi:MAG: nucleoside triphosphate pyrophosphohydrolase [Bacteroidales bacterium]|nr:nucleoside triphosphate pyrophosphohydrolase [Bacteroidales bacterium]
MDTSENKNHQAIDRLLNIMSELRLKCPWDKKQTMESLRCNTIEEVYELADAVMDGNMDEIRKELGDILLHVVFYCKIGEEQGKFNFADVANGLCEKLIVRHPHVFGNVNAETDEDVKVNWEKIKLQSKEGRKSVLEGVPDSLPAMIKAYRIQDKVHGVNFDWQNPQDVLNKVKEEIAEFEHEQQEQNQEKMENELGDVLFSVINYARFMHINPENALEKTNRKFIRRFQRMEQAIAKDNKDITDMQLNEMDIYWNQIKEDEK